MIKRRLFTAVHVVVAAIVAIVLLTPLTVAADGSSASVQEAQTIMTKFGIPTGTVDGYYGPNTARGLCAARQMAGYTPNRNNVDSALLAKMRSWNKTYGNLQAMPAPKLDGRTTYLLVLQKCQAILYVANGKYSRVMATSTGMNASQSDDGKDHRTPTNKSYLLGYTQRGWSCSTLYPEGCSHHPGVGMNSGVSDYGNMYNKRAVVGDVFVHGSTSVPPHPASHGCIRVTVADSDWMFKNVGNGPKPYIKITGSY
jgi:hypothetical protein